MIIKWVTYNDGLPIYYQVLLSLRDLFQKQAILNPGIKSLLLQNILFFQQSRGLTLSREDSSRWIKREKKWHIEVYTTLLHNQTLGKINNHSLPLNGGLDKWIQLLSFSWINKGTRLQSAAGQSQMSIAQCSKEQNFPNNSDKTPLQRQALSIIMTDQMGQSEFYYHAINITKSTGLGHKWKWRQLMFRLTPFPVILGYKSNVLNVKFPV